VTSPPTRIRIVATSDSTVTPVTGLFETLRSVGPLIAPEDRGGAPRRPFDVEIVAESAGVIACPSGLAVTAHRSVDEVPEADVVIVPSMAFGREGEWIPGRYPKLVRWLRQMYEGGATLCSACTGANLTAETGLLDGNEATVHWAQEKSFRRRHPEVVLRLEDVLVISGDGGRLITSGAATAWHDLCLFLIARHVGPATAQAVARFMLFQWHREGQAAFQVFDPPTDHGDAAVLAAQRAIAEHFAVAAPVEEMVRWSGLAPRTFKRRFKLATDHTPIAYVQRVRVERAKRLLETSDESVEEISWAVGTRTPPRSGASSSGSAASLPGHTGGGFRSPWCRPAPEAHSLP
jgi:transcriptional regulator GlxA family with amidase domain